MITREEIEKLKMLTMKAQEQLDCGSSSCVFKKSEGGMRTNGPCHCLETKAPYPRCLWREATPNKILNIIESYEKLEAALACAERLLIEPICDCFVHEKKHHDNCESKRFGECLAEISKIKGEVNK